LIVDDNPKNIQVLGNMLRDEGYSIGYAYNGKQALEILKEIGGFDLVLLDINMPVMDGLETCRKMRNDKILKEIPVIFLTALNQTEDLVAGFKAGGQDYVSKPYNYDEILARVKTHIDLKQSKDKLNTVNQWLEAKVQERTKELKSSHLQLQKAYQKLQSLDTTKSEFLSIISHQINTPLNGIIGLVNLLKYEISDPHLQEMFKYLEISANRLDNFSKVSLMITRLRTQDMPIEKKDISIIEIVESSKQALTDELKNKNISIKNQHNESKIKGDRELIKFCFESILDNAINYSPDYGTILIKIDSNTQNTNINFEDEGEGFNPEILNNLFDLFISDNKFNEESNGLDLALVKLIMVAHNGNIVASNNDIKGANITLTFPNDQNN
jgi:two-component system sensor histidine kinase/response regulator